MFHSSLGNRALGCLRTTPFMAELMVAGGTGCGPSSRRLGHADHGPRIAPFRGHAFISGMSFFAAVVRYPCGRVRNHERVHTVVKCLPSSRNLHARGNEMRWVAATIAEGRRNGESRVRIRRRRLRAGF